MLLLPIVSILFFQGQGGDSVLAARIRQLLHVVITTDNEKQEAAAEAEAREIFSKRGLPVIAAVGDEAAYEFVVLACLHGPEEFQKQVLRKAREGAKRHEIPPDAVIYSAAHVSQEIVKAKARKHAPADPALRDEIERLFTVDQAVREKNGFDMEKMMRTDREHAPALEAIFEKHGVPAYRMVGPQAASDFITMLQHQPPEFRRRVLPKLKANVDAGQADPRSYAQMLDRLLTDAGQKQTYGENLTCDPQHPRLHTGPIEDGAQVNRRRAAIGLVRLELYAQLVVEMSPNFCGAPN
ncbi:MAG: hypothetical protein LAP38_20025 [Acidobacteriia bacterium]|nr:hypothetical protein [Terriglobia bacterium]